MEHHQKAPEEFTMNFPLTWKSFTGVKHLAIWEASKNVEVLLMEEIRLTTWHVWNLWNHVKNGTNYQPQLVQDFWTINSLSW